LCFAGGCALLANNPEAIMIPSEKLDQIRKLARVRMRNQRQRDRANRLPSTREIDGALRDGLVMFMAKSNLRRPSDLVGHPTLAPVLHFAIEELARSHFDTKSHTTVERFWRRLRLFGA
jgi:hypothetical protein